MYKSSSNSNNIIKGGEEMQNKEKRDPSITIDNPEIQQPREDDASTNYPEEMPSRYGYIRK